MTFSSAIPCISTKQAHAAERLEKGQCFGGELLEWVLRPTDDDMYNLSKVQVSSKTLKTHTKVEVFALMAHDLKHLQSQEASIIQRIWRSRKLQSQATTLKQSQAASRVQRGRRWWFKKTCFDV